ncbi:MAG: acyl-CoA desaturase, partial [bacterium]|nr:acyl-CoA desaturase [bacterium]
LFPGISNIHYKNLAKIVQQTAKEFNVPYHSYPTLFQALRSHISFMRTIGQTAEQGSNHPLV